MVQVCGGPRGSGPRAPPRPPPPLGGFATPTARARRKGVRRRHEGDQDGVLRAATQRGSREAAARPPPTPPTGPQATGAPAPTARGRGDGLPPPPRPREEPERDPPPRPTCRLPQGPRRTSEPAPTRQYTAQIAPSEGGRARTGVVWGARPPMDRTTPVTPALLPAQGRQRYGTRQSDARPSRPPPAAQMGGTAHAPPPQPAPRHTNATGPPRGAQPPQGVQTKGPPHPHARAHSTWIADPNRPPSGRAVGGGGAPDPRRPSQQWKAPPPGTPFCHPHNPKTSRGEPGPDRPPPSTPHGARDRGRTRGGARTTWNGPTSAQCRDRARCARDTTQEGRERTPRERERTHTQRARGDYQKGNRTEHAERTDRVEWRTSERG